MKIKALVCAILFFGALFITAAAVASANKTRCIYCESEGYGKCPSVYLSNKDNRSPSGMHKHESDGEHCLWCGSTMPGYCNLAPGKKHEF